MRAALAHPPERDARGVIVAGAHEVADEQPGHDELHDGSTREADQLPEWTKDEVSGFVDGQIHAVQQASFPQMREQISTIKRERGAQDAPGN
ncbi:MAG: hypothetical protein ABIP93_15645 [Gemmatimonadaceae bacterium]